MIGKFLHYRDKSPISLIPPRNTPVKRRILVSNTRIGKRFERHTILIPSTGIAVKSGRTIRYARVRKERITSTVLATMFLILLLSSSGERAELASHEPFNAGPEPANTRAQHEIHRTEIDDINTDTRRKQSSTRSYTRNNMPNEIHSSNPTQNQGKSKKVTQNEPSTPPNTPSDKHSTPKKSDNTAKENVPERSYPSSREGVKLLIRDVFVEKASNAIAIAECESGLDPNAYNPNDPHGGSVGIFQINGAHGNLSSFYDPITNVEFAYQLSSGGTNFSRDWVNCSRITGVP